MKILLIGDKGFTGKHLIKILTNEVELYNGSDYGIDLLQDESIRAAIKKIRPRVIINLAARSSVLTNSTPELFQINGFSIRTLLESSIEFGVEKLIQASTSQIYGHRTGLCKESDASFALNAYAVSKIMSEAFCQMYADKLKVVITRPFSCIGQGQKDTFLLPKLISAFKKRIDTIELGLLGIEKDFIDIRTIAAIYKNLIFNDSFTGPINLCSGNVTSIQTLLDHLSDLTGHRLEIKYNPAFVRKGDILTQRGCVTLLNSIGQFSNYSVKDSLAWMLTSE